MTPIDATILTRPLSLRETIQEIRTHSPAWTVGVTVMLATAFVPLIILIVFAGSVLRDGGAVALIVLLALGGLFGLYDIYKDLDENVKAKRLAEHNGMTYIAEFWPARDYTGYPFERGMVVPRAVRTQGDYFTEFGYLRAPNYRRTHFGPSATYVRVILPRTLPHIILAKRGTTVGLAADEGSEALTLEGSFGDIFELFAPKGHAQDALYIFTPDVMERFVQAAKDFNCEIIGNQLYMVASGKISIARADGIQKLQDCLGHIMPKFDSQSAKYTAAQGQHAAPVVALRSREPVWYLVLALFAALCLSGLLLWLIA